MLASAARYDPKGAAWASNGRRAANRRDAIPTICVPVRAAPCRFTFMPARIFHDHFNFLLSPVHCFRLCTKRCDGHTATGPVAPATKIRRKFPKIFPAPSARFSGGETGKERRKVPPSLDRNIRYQCCHASPL